MSEFHLATQLLAYNLSIFSRAGGGGSGGDGGSLIILIGYVPMHVLGARFRRIQGHRLEFGVLQIIGWAIAIAYGISLTLLVGSYGFVTAIAAFLGMGAGLYSWFSKLKQSKMTQQNLALAAQHDKLWDETTILNHAKDCFTRYQQDWSNFNTEGMKAYMTPSYQYHSSLMLYALQQASRQNYVQNPVISAAVIVHVDDQLDNNQDQVTVGFTANAKDQLIDRRDNTTLFVDNKPFTEFWRFIRQGNDWLLDGIQQATASYWVYNASLEAFAVRNDMYFSLDWGWLLLPRRGQLFGDGKFGVSDINNHVIGVHGQCLVQLYTYNTRPNKGKTYLIAQTNVPKQYDDIVVRRKKGFSLFGIHGLQNVSTEWPQFNKKYEVYATSLEGATSLELLNPLFMEKLEALPFEVSIEVVDNVIYLYAPQSDKRAANDRYAIMLTILNEAFKEMKL